MKPNKMSRKLESIFADKVIKDLRNTFGKDIWVENIQQVGKVGTPDLLICLKGNFIALELKLDTGKIAPLQYVKLLEIKKAGGKSCIVTPHYWFVILKELIEVYGS